MEPKVNVEIEKRNEQDERKRFKGYILGIRNLNQNVKEKEESK